MAFSRFKSKLGFPQLLISRTARIPLGVKQTEYIGAKVVVVVAWL